MRMRDCLAEDAGNLAKRARRWHQQPGRGLSEREGQGRESKIAAPEGGKEDKFIFVESRCSAEW